MAKRTITQLLDDIDGSEAAESITFSVDGTNYSIDLNEKNARAFYEAVEPYTSVATKVGRFSGASRSSGSSSSSRSKNTDNKEDLNALREWARKNGYEVADRGRISQQIRDAYHAAH